MGIRKYSANEFKGLPLKQWGQGKAFGNLDPSAISGKRLDVASGSIDSWGVWEASPGTFVREVKAGEFMHILEGACTFTPEDGGEIAVAAGDYLFFPPDTRGVWRITSPMRKLYMLFHSEEDTQNT